MYSMCAFLSLFLRIISWNILCVLSFSLDIQASYILAPKIETSGIRAGYDLMATMNLFQAQICKVANLQTLKKNKEIVIKTIVILLEI